MTICAPRFKSTLDGQFHVTFTGKHIPRPTPKSAEKVARMTQDKKSRYERDIASAMAAALSHARETSEVHFYELLEAKREQLEAAGLAEDSTAFREEMVNEALLLGGTGTDEHGQPLELRPLLDLAAVSLKDGGEAEGKGEGEVEGEVEGESVDDRYIELIGDTVDPWDEEVCEE